MATDKNYFEQLPTWTKGVIAVVVTAGVAFAAWKTYQYMQNKFGNENEKKVGNEALSVVDELKRKGKKLSAATPDYSSTANFIEKSLSGCEGTQSEVDVVENISKLVKSPIDWYYLVSVFGNRDIADCGTFGGSKSNYDLPSLLKEQLDTAVVAGKVNGKMYYATDTIDILREYLKKIGISI